MDWEEQRKRWENEQPNFYTYPEDMSRHAYDNTGYMYPGNFVPATRFTGAVNSFPRNGHPSLKRRNERGTEHESYQRNKRRCILVAVIVVSTLLICGIVGAIIGVVFAQKNDSSSQREPLTETRIVEQQYPGEATLNDLVFTSDYKNPDSTVYKQTEQDFIAKVDNQMRQSSMGDTYNRTVVNGFSEGSVKIDYIMIFNIFVFVTVDNNGAETGTNQTPAPSVSMAFVAQLVASIDIVQNDSVTVAETSACDSSPCINGASCTGVETYTCECLAGYSGTECEVDIDDCSSTPCENGGACTDQVNSFTCDCVSGYSGSLCHINIDDCNSDLCKNGGTCKDGVDSYSCDCQPGFTGNQCDTNIDECASSPCEHGGICLDKTNSYSCTCAAGYTDANCETNINECQSDPCLNSGTCLDDVNSYICICNLGYTGSQCETNMNECAADPCQNGGSCTDGVNSYTCTCSAGFTGINCDDNTNECGSSPCQNSGTCIDLVNSYICQCTSGYTGDRCEADIDECNSNPCQHGGSCSDSVDSYTCSCAPGYTGDRCENNIDECSSNPCQNGGACTDDVDAFSCTCVAGYAGVFCQSELNECSSSPCMNGGDCTNLINYYTCSCLDGFMGNNCEIDINECQGNPCQNNGTCNDETNGFRCYCVNGYTGKLCQTEIDECASNPCQNGDCTEFLNGYSCTCHNGYTGENCNIDKDECSSSPCQNGATCQDDVNRYACDCAPGYIGSRCQIDVDECTNSPCLHGTCTNTPGSYTCTCEPGYLGHNCDDDVDECTSSPCLHGTCTNTPGSYNCTCEAGYLGHNCDDDVDECTSSPCLHGTCTNTPGSYTCTCEPGYLGHNCDNDVDECTSSPCLHGTCTNTPGSYTCTCEPGYLGHNCDNDVDECTSSPCLHGTCTNTPGSYTCTCEPGYLGHNCDDDIDECTTSSCQHGTCSNLPGSYTCTCDQGYIGTTCDDALPTTEPTFPLSPSTTATSTATTATTTITPTTTPALVMNCSSGENLVELWVSLHRYNYSANLLNRSSAEFILQSKHLNSVISLIDTYTGIIGITNIAHFQRLNGSSNSTATVQACVSSINNTDDLYDLMYTYSFLTGLSFLGLRLTDRSPVALTTNFSCPFEYHTCTSGLLCIPYSFFCNGVDDCSDAGDEHYLLCNYTTNSDVPTTVPTTPGRNITNTTPTITTVSTTTTTSQALPTTEPTFPLSPSTTATASATTATTTITPTTTPAPVMNCSSGENLVELWVSLHRYNYSANLLNRSSAEFLLQSNYLNSVISLTGIIGITNIAHFQRLNGSSNSTATVQACVSSINNTDDLYDLMYTYSFLTDIYGLSFLGLRLTDRSPVALTTNFSCPFEYHTCTSGLLCIPYSFFCNGVDDCSDAGDEHYLLCNYTTNSDVPTTVPTTPGRNITNTTPTITTVSTTTTSQGPCASDKYTCYTIHQCVDKSSLCDGIYDCGDYSDEWSCPTTPYPIPTAVDVRLMEADNDTTDQLFGRVEVRPAGSTDELLWGTVCDDMWGIEEARVVCRKLGYSGEDVYIYSNAWFGPGTGQVYLGNMRCQGTELDLMDCDSTARWGSIHCGHNQDASVSCGVQFTTTTLVPPPTSTRPPPTSTRPPPTEPPRSSISLRDGSTCLDGLLEVTIEGQTGTVCDDRFDSNSADVACKTLGYAGASAYGNLLFDFSGNSSTPILMDDIQCRGDEITIFNCSYTMRHNCRHYEDVGVICEGDPDILCYDGPVVESVNCNFTQHNCQYTQDTVEGEANWRHGNSADFDNQDAFMYLSGEEGSARLIAPSFHGTEEIQSVEFMYNIKDSHYQNLILVMNEAATDPDTQEVTHTEHEVWTSVYQPSDIDRKWIYLCKQLPTTEGRDYNLIFKGSISSDTQIGLDSINVTATRCQESILDRPCTFDRLSECGVNFACDAVKCQRDTHVYRWYWENRGPHASETLIRTYSAYGEEGETANVSYALPYLRDDWYLKFKGHMYGLHSGQLKVALDINGREFKTIIVIRGNQGPEWSEWCAKLPEISLDETYDIVVRFEATLGSGLYDNIYLDDIEILTDEYCEVSGAIADSFWTLEYSSSAYAFSYEDYPLGGRLRLVGGSRNYRGYLEVYHDGQWFGICDRNEDFGRNELEIACRQLGFDDFSYTYTAYADKQFWLADIKCTGTESSILECERSDWGDTPRCSNSDHLYAVCWGNQTDIPLSYFPSNLFFVKDTNTVAGAWTTLESKTWVNNDPGVPMKLLFEMHKGTPDNLKIWLREGSNAYTTILKNITKTTEYEQVCVELSSMENTFVIGLTATKTILFRSEFELRNFEISNGHCKAPIGLEICDFQSEYVGCSFTVEVYDDIPECVTPYQWHRASPSTDSSVFMSNFTLQNSGHFMYINNKRGVGSNSSLHLAVLDSSQDYVPFICSLRFMHFGGHIDVNINGNWFTVLQYPVQKFVWRQKCIMIDPSGSCPYQPGKLEISFWADSVEAGLDDIYISSEPCPENTVSCDFENGDNCGFGWSKNLTILNGTLRNKEDTYAFTISSPYVRATENDMCFITHNTGYIDYILKASVYDFYGNLSNATYTHSDHDVYLTVGFTGIIGDWYSLILEGIDDENRVSSVKSVSIDYVHFYNMPCSSVEIPCKTTQFSCGDGSCYNSSAACDGKRDCPSGVDEQGCDCTSSYYGYNLFNCSLTGCIRSSLRCDGTEDCMDGSDEICDPSLSCTFNESYICGYRLFKFYINEISSILTMYDFDFGYIESPEMTIVTETCYTVNFGVHMFYYREQSSIRIVSNTSNSLNVLANVDTNYPYGASNHSISVPLQAGTYSVIFETQGLDVLVLNVTSATGGCPAVIPTEPITTSSTTADTTHIQNTTMSGTTSTTRTSMLGSDTTTSDATQTLHVTSALPSTTTTSDATKTLHVTSTLPSTTNTSDATQTLHVTSTLPSTTTPLPDDFPVVVATSPVHASYGQNIDLSCTVDNNLTAYQAILFWSLGDRDQVIARNSDIMLEDDAQTKYVVDLTISTVVDYTLTVRVDPHDGEMIFYCWVVVVGHPVYDQLIAEVHLSVPVPVQDSSTCVPNPIYACSEFGYDSYMLPSVNGLTNHSHIQDNLLDIFYSNSSEPTGACLTVLRHLSCGLYTPKCIGDASTVPVCREHCKDIANSCSRSILPNVMKNYLDYFCKFLPYSTEATCETIHFGCGSHINTSATEFDFESDAYPLKTQGVPCSYSISGPPMETYFKWLEITILDLRFTEETCPLNSLVVGDETLCSDTEIPKVITIQKPSVEMTVNNGAFKVSVKYIMPFCNVYDVNTFYGGVLLEVTADMQCSTWAFVLGRYLQNTHQLNLHILSIDGGCIVLDDNTGAVTTQVCGPETVNIASTNVTVTKDSDDVAFTLNVTAISNEDLEVRMQDSESLVITGIELVGNSVDGKGFVRLQRSDGTFGIACYINDREDRDYICEHAGYNAPSNFTYNRDHPDDLTKILYNLKCGDHTDISKCTGDWLDLNEDRYCYSAMELECTLPSVSCDFSRSRCGYQEEDTEETSSAQSPLFNYTMGTSVTFTYTLRGTFGDSLILTLIPQNSESVDVYTQLTPLENLEGEYNVCVPLPNDLASTNVQLKFTFSHVSRHMKDMFSSIRIQLHDDGCQDVFPEGTCSFDNLIACEPFISATCSLSSDTVWKITEGQFLGDAKHGVPLMPQVFPLALQEVTSSTTKFLHFVYFNNGSLYYQNFLNFSIGLNHGSQLPVYTHFGPSNFSIKQCIQIDLQPAFPNILLFELVSNKSLGFVGIDNVTLNDVPCPHPSSCDFEKDCPITADSDTSSTRWKLTLADDLQTEDHTLNELPKGSYMALFDYGGIGASRAWFTLATIPVDSQYQCFTFFYQTTVSNSMQSSTAFLTVQANYTTASSHVTKTYGIAEYRDIHFWKEAQVPIEGEDWDDMTFSIMVTKVFDDSDVLVLVDDISFEFFACKYGVENLEVCTFDDPMKCLFSANGTVDSGYIWDVYKEDFNSSDADSYLHILNSFGPENAESYVWFKVDLAGKNMPTSYQFQFLSTENAGTLDTFLMEEYEEEFRRRKKRATLGFNNITLVGNNQWLISDCYSIPENFLGYIFLHASRGQSDQGKMAIDNLKIHWSDCIDPIIDCTFGDNRCGYSSDLGGWTLTENGISSTREGSGLLVPLHKLEYQTGCLNFYGVLSSTSTLDVHVASATQTDIYHIGLYSDNLFDGQVNISMSETKSVKFVLPANPRDILQRIIITDGYCSSTLYCNLGSPSFKCEEKCIDNEKQCDGIQDCHSGLDEDDCGYSIDCTFESSFCSYSGPGGWKLYSSYEFLDEQDISLSIEPINGGMALVKFDEYTTAHAVLTSRATRVHNDSCLIFTYTGTVATLDLSITYANGTVMLWQDPTVRGNTHDWKPAVIDVSPGYVSVSFKTSMIRRDGDFPTLQIDAFLIIDTIRLESQRCSDVITLPACPTGMSMCGDRSKCIPDEYFCDYTQDCPDLSDESDCQEVYKLECTFEDEYLDHMCFYETLEESNTWITSQSRPNQLPADDHTFNNKSGYFMMHSIPEDFYGNQYDATLVSAPVLYNTDICVTFWYFMNSTRFQPDGVTAQLVVSVDYQDNFDIPQPYWYDSADRYLPNWIQGAVPVQGNRTVKLLFTAKTSTPVSVWPGVVAVDDIDVIEGDCTITQACRENTFECSNTGVCIPNNFRCDGTNHCSDKSDERNCEKPVNVIEVIGGDGSYGRARAFVDTTWRPVCFPFYDSEMVARSVCRNKGYRGLSEAFSYQNADSNQEPASLDCTIDGNCTANVSTCTSFLGVKCSTEVCFSGYRLCPDSKFHCIPESRFCDGLQDCDGNTDELGCATCAMGEFECGNHECVSLLKRCDGKVDCGDGTDEFRCVQVDVDVGEVTVWDQIVSSRYPVCVDEIDRNIAEKLCQLSGNGYLAVPGIHFGMTTVSNGVHVRASQDPTSGTLVPGLDKIAGNMECYPLHLDCALPECGTTIVTELAVQQYIFFGDKAVLGEYPWHCALYNGAYFRCGASYIGHGYFLTAAHCVESGQSFTVKCGTTSVQHLGEHGSQYTITRYTRHPLYKIELVVSDYDVAVLQTTTHPMIDNFTRPTCLGNSDDWAFILGLGKAAECYTTGFGYTETYATGGRDEDQELLETRVDFIDIDLCNRTMNELGVSLFDDSLCINSDSPYPPTCSGDSGSPTVCRDPRDGRWYQFSLTSWGLGCYAPGTADVQNMVFPYLEWIEEVTDLKFTKA